jgi:hypothetical protein
LKNSRNNDLADRRSAASAAKASLLDAYRDAQTSNEVTRAAKQAERAAIVEAREARRVERERVKSEERIQLEAQAAEAQAAAEALIETRKATEDELVARVVKDDAERKAERDRRYANRKARQG